MRYSNLFLILALLAPGSVRAQEPADRFARVAQRVVEALVLADGNAIQPDFDEGMKYAFPPDRAAKFFKRVSEQVGRFNRLEAPKLTGADQAIVTARFEKDSLDIKLVLDSKDRIAGLWLLPHPPEPKAAPAAAPPAPAPPVEAPAVAILPVPAAAVPAADVAVTTEAVPASTAPATEPAPSAPVRSETVFDPPFKGRWLTHWGGDTYEPNRHHHVPSQRFALDFAGADASGVRHKGEGKANEDFFAFGREILAPADGVVLEAIDGVRDNVPGSMNPFSALGNAVVLRHEGATSVLAHLKQGSVRVKAGDTVTRGQVLGLCGNSGNSSEPHLHFHVQDSAVLQDGAGVKVLFREVPLLQGGLPAVKTAYSPVKGDLLDLP